LTEVNSNVNGTSTPLTVPPQRPGLAPVPPSQRNSMIAGSTISINSRSPTPSSPYAPRIISISDNAWVRALLSLPEWLRKCLFL
jgi:hypothetical protein